MDLLDLYHAHDHSLALEEELEPEEGVVSSTVSKKPAVKVKEAKFVPWEPYRAAPAHDRKGEAPSHVPTLIPYSKPASLPQIDASIPENHFVDTRKGRIKDSNDNNLSSSPNVVALQKELSHLHCQLEAERGVNRELKSIFLKSLGDDFQCEVEALAGDKVQLGRRLEDYCEKVVALTQQLEDSRIEADVWKCKFQAQSIRCDDLSRNLNTAANIIFRGQEALLSVRDMLPDDLKRLASFDVQSLVKRSPCDTRILPKTPNFKNVCVTCCKNCSGREIILL